MNIGDCVRHSLDEWDRKEWNAAMLHACNAVDGTGKKRYPEESPAARFKHVVRDDLDVFRAMTMPGVDLAKTRWPVAVRSHLPDKRPDIADVIYGIHRCSHGHGEDLPEGFDVTPPDEVPTPDGGTYPASTFFVEKGKVRLPASTVIGLLAIAILAPENRDQKIAFNYRLTLPGRVFEIGDWWGWIEHFRSIISSIETNNVELTWGDWWDDWTPV